ncbi:MAG: Outer membrane efflux protein [Bacteroidetes bacterium ADurb.BinA104]|jgi:outer membrane protein|nr:MAG: Outer membrane efflux protein [Bacteroidetes bacterium ADurb.BinA104]
MYMKKRFFGICLCLLSLTCSVCTAQVIEPRTLTMQDVVRLAQENSISAMSNRNVFASAYWRFRSFRAELLPSLSINAGIGNFNRSLVALQDYNTGAISYRANYNLSNEATLNFTQNIPWTGGRVSLSTHMSRLDQYSPTRRTTYYVQPIYLSYMQSLRGHNRFHWSRKIEPKQYEAAKREYIERMEQTNLTAVTYFWNYASLKERYERALKNFTESKRLFEAGQTRFLSGAITRDQLMQIEVTFLNDSLSMSSTRVSLRTSLNRLCSYIGYQDDTELNLIIDYNVPDLTLDYDDVLERALKNSSFQLEQEISYIDTERSVSQAKSNRGISAQINARFGMSGSGGRLDDTFVSLKDQEVIGVQLNIPILDWGLARGRVRMAEANAETTRNRLEQNMIDYRQDLFTQVMQFNDQRSRCDISKRAAELAEDSYQLALSNFSSGSMTMSQLDQLKDKRDSAFSSYLSNVASFWNSYFRIRRATLYDYITGTDITAEFDKLIK